VLEDPVDIIIKPILSEKSARLKGDNIYTFIVAPQATKTQIKEAIEEIFKVRVRQVNIANRKGKKKRLGVHQGRTSSWKKAIVILHKGEIIEELE